VHPKRQHFTLAPAARRHKRYWLLDGSVVLHIKDTMFKLHRSRLAQQSQYFTTLFAERNDRGVLIWMMAKRRSWSSMSSMGVPCTGLNACP